MAVALDGSCPRCGTELEVVVDADAAKSDDAGRIPCPRCGTTAVLTPAKRQPRDPPRANSKRPPPPNRSEQ